MTKGIFYGVGVGPGDPELLTLQAVRVIESCPILAVPETKSGGTLALDIVSQVVDVSKKTVVPLSFPMTRDETVTRENHRVQSAKIAEYLEKGQDVAMINLGDVSVFSTFSYIMEQVRNMGYPVQMVPGVTSFCAVAAKLTTSLTEKEEPLHIIPAGYDGVAECLSLSGTKVLMKPRKDIRSVVAALEQEGLLECSSMVENCGLPDERVYPTLQDFEEDSTGYFTTVVVRKKK
jgi:precorrin-2/cobalt-factor-2 C20-methyltransferase